MVSMSPMFLRPHPHRDCKSFHIHTRFYPPFTSIIVGHLAIILQMKWEVKFWLRQDPVPNECSHCLTVLREGQPLCRHSWVKATFQGGPISNDGNSGTLLGVLQLPFDV